MSLARNTLVQATLTLGSRVLGFVRDLLLAQRFGQGPLMDAFATALMAPNLFRRLFAEGAFAQAFVPVYGRVRAQEGEAAAEQAASQAMSFMLWAVTAFVIVLQLLMPWIMPWLLSAWRDEPQVIRLATLATQIAMPYLACMSVAALLSGVLNTGGRFALSAAVPALLNLCTIAPLLLAPDQDTALLWTSAGVTVSGALQAALLWWATHRLGVRIRLGSPRLSPTVKRVLALSVPGALAGGATQISSLVSQVLTGSDAGARSTLYNADRLYQLPLGLVGVAIGLALVPRLTRAFVEADHDGARRTLDDGVGLSMALTLPAAAALLVMPFFLIDAAVTRGAFTSADAARTADVLRQFAWGVPAFVLAKVFTPPFFARQDMRTPTTFAMISVALNVALSAGLFFGLSRLGYDGVVGLGVATSVAGWLNVTLLATTLARRGIWRPSAALISRLARVVAATLVMSALLFAGAWFYPELSAWLWRKEVAVLCVCAAGFGVYALAALALRAVTVSELKSVLRRERGESALPVTALDP